MTPRGALLLFARSPRLGQVKSRLMPRFSAAEALALHRALLMDSLDLVTRAAQACAATPLLYLSEAGEVDAALSAHLGAMTVKIQQGADLGERLLSAFRECFETEHREIVVLGSDSPHLPDAYVARAFEELRKAEIVIGPARDGGYYLLGASRLPASLLTDMPWGTPQVYRETVRRARKDGVSITSLPAWYDVDRPESVIQLWRDLASRRSRGEDPLPRACLSLLEAWDRGNRLG